MSRIKAALPEGYSVLNGSELDGTPETPNDEDLAVGFAMQDLTKAVGILEQYKPYSEYSEIDGLTARLQQLLADMDKPF